MDVQSHHQLPQWIDSLFENCISYLTNVCRYLVKCPRKGAIIIANFNLSFYGVYFLFYIYYGILGTYYLYQKNLKARVAISIDSFELDYTCLDVLPSTIFLTMARDIIIAILFIYFNFKLLQATKKKNIQSMYNWLVFHSLHLTYSIMIMIALGLIKKSIEYLVMGCFNSIFYFSSILMVKRFYDYERNRKKRNTYNITLRAENPVLRTF